MNQFVDKTFSNQHRATVAPDSFVPYPFASRSRFTDFKSLFSLTKDITIDGSLVKIQVQISHPSTAHTSQDIQV